MGHTAFSDLDSPSPEFLMDFGHTAMFPESQCSYQSNHIQTKFAMGQGPTPLLFWPISVMILLTLAIGTLADD
jgi:hypothetical protein